MGLLEEYSSMLKSIFTDQIKLNLMTLMPNEIFHQIPNFYFHTN